jgi:transposase
MTSPKRYIGLDVHKQQVTVTAVDSQQQVVLAPGEIAIQHFPTWAEANMNLTDEVALEATSNAWELYDQLEPLVAAVTVANAHKVKLISSGRAKTDKQDALVLAKLLAANLLPAVWVPPIPVRELRSLIAHRERLCRDRRATKNRLHSILHRYNLLLPEGDPFSQANETWWHNLPLASSEQLRIRHGLLQLQHLNLLLHEVEAELSRLSVKEPWVDQVAFLIQMPGIGLLSAMTILSAGGDIQRFPTAKHLVGYSGLGASVHSSGQTQRTGPITKQGRRELRTTLVESAWIAVTCSPYWRDVFDRLKVRLGKHKAIVAVARKMLVTIWHLLTHRTRDRHTDTNTIARSLMAWASKHRLATSTGLKRPQFVWRELDRLGIGQSMDTFTFSRFTYGRQPKRRRRSPVAP